MAPTPTVSVVVPTRNRAALAAAVVRSILAQDAAAELEVIAVDEASSDGTGERLAGLDPRVRVLRHEVPRGVSAARNAGLAAAAGALVAFTDDDDRWAPTKLARQLAALEAVPAAGWCLAGTVVVDRGGDVLAHEPTPAVDDLAARLLRMNAVPGGGSGILVRRDLVAELGGFEESLATLADWELWTRLALAAPAAAADGPLLAYLRHPGSMSHALVGIGSEIARLEALHAPARARLGVRFGRAEVWNWVAEMRGRGGHRRGAASAYLAAARAGDARSLARAGAALALRDHVGRRDARRRDRVPEAWRAAVASWLEPL